MSDPDLTAIAHFFSEVGYLKRLPRTGWLVAGVQAPENIAAHSFRAAIMAMVIAYLEGGDPTKAASLALLHDTQETRIGDVPGVGKAYVRTADNVTVTQDQTMDLPAGLADFLVGMVSEYEARESVEARAARDADKLDCLLQAREYQEAGNQAVQPWIDSSMRAMKTETGRRLGELCQKVDPRDWYAAAAAEYPRLQRPERPAAG